MFIARENGAHGLPPVRFTDEHGELVPARAREQLRTGQRLSDEQKTLLARLGPRREPCPICQSTDRRADPVEPAATGPGNLCASCGHQDSAAVLVGGRPSPKP